MTESNELLEALCELQKQVRAHIKFDVKKHYSLMVADAAATAAIGKAQDRRLKENLASIERGFKARIASYSRT